MVQNVRTGIWRFFVVKASVNGIELARGYGSTPRLARLKCQAKLPNNKSFVI